MARVPDYTPYDHMGAAKQLGSAIGRILPEAVGAYAQGKKTEQDIESGKLDITRKKQVQLKEWKADKSLKKKKEIFRKDLETTLAKAPNDWAKRQFEYLDATTTNEEFDTVASNITRMLQASQDYGKKYPYLSLANPDPAAAGAALKDKAADSYISSLDTVVENSHQNYINEAAKELAANPKIKTSDEAVAEFAKKHFGEEGANLTPGATKMLKEAFSLSKQDLVNAETRRIKAEASATKANTARDMITEKTFTSLNGEENKLVAQALKETNLELSRVSNFGKFYESPKYKALAPEKKVLLDGIIKKISDTRDKKEIIKAARALNISLDQTKVENALNDINDDGRPSTPLHKRLLEQMRKQGSSFIPEQVITGEATGAAGDSPFGYEFGQEPQSPAPPPATQKPAAKSNPQSLQDDAAFLDSYLRGE